MSRDFKNLVSNLQSDFQLIARFIASPENVLSDYDLTLDQRNALLSQDMNALSILTGDSQLAAGVLSDAHTPTCNPTKITI